MIGGLYQNHVYLPKEQRLAPTTSTREGRDYLDLGNLPEDEMLEMLGTSHILFVFAKL